MISNDKLMKISDLYEIVKERQLSRCLGYYACPLADGVYLASIEMCPALLIKKTSIYRISESFSLKYLNVYSYNNCLLSIAGTDINADLIVIKVNSSDSDLIEWVLSLLESFVDSISFINNNQDFCFLVDKFVSIFSKIDSPPSGTVIGLIGELLLIYSSPDADVLISGWHVDTTSRIDFTNKDIRIEVKTTTKQQRLHRVKLNQLAPFEGVIVYFASLILDLVSDGVNLLDLINLVAAKCNNKSSKIKLSSMVSETLGCDIRLVKNLQFDLESALYSLCIYKNTDIPRPLISEIPAGITNISFDLDFSAVQKISAVQRADILS